MEKMAPSAINPSAQAPGPQSSAPPPKLHTPRELHFEKYLPIQPDGYRKARSLGPERAAIVIDNGTHCPISVLLYMLINQAGSSGTRAGWSFEDAPCLNVTPIFSKYRDRKVGKTYSFVGADVYADTTARGHMRNAFEAGSGIVSNWDVMESILDYIFIKMGISGANGIDMPIVMTEAVANLPYSRKCKFLRVIHQRYANNWT